MLQKSVSRRNLLKGIIAGSGGIAAAAFLPEKWIKPVIKSGVLPADAQASGFFINAAQNVNGIMVFVTSTPFTIPIVNRSIGTFKLASPMARECPVDGQPGVTVEISGANFTDGQTKITDECGYVRWDLCDAPGFTGGLITISILGGQSCSLSASAVSAEDCEEA